MNWAQIAEDHEKELQELQERFDDLVLEKTVLQEKLTQSTRRVEELEELVTRPGMEGDDELLRKLTLLEETVVSLEEENKQLRAGHQGEEGFHVLNVFKFELK